MKVFVNGKFYSEQNAKISVFDHGLLYGDGVFEGIRAYHGRVFKLKEHIDRLFYSAKGHLLDIPMTHQQLMDATVEACRRNGITDGYIRLVVTRGAGTLGLGGIAGRSMCSLNYGRDKHGCPSRHPWSNTRILPLSAPSSQKKNEGAPP